MWREILSKAWTEYKFNFVNWKVHIHHIKMHFIKIYKVEQTV